MSKDDSSTYLGIESLEELHVARNPIRELPESLLRLPNLKLFNVYHQKLVLSPRMEVLLEKLQNKGVQFRAPLPSGRIYISDSYD